MNTRILSCIAAAAAFFIPAFGHAQAHFQFETVPYGSQTALTETDSSASISATFSSLSTTTDAFQVLENVFQSGVPFYSYNMRHHVLIENSAGESTLQVHLSAMQQTLQLSFGLPNSAAQLILEIPSLGITKTFTGTNTHPAGARDLPFEGTITFKAKTQRFNTFTLHTVGATDGAFGIDNVHTTTPAPRPGVTSVPEGSSIAMFTLGGLPLAAFFVRRRLRG